MIAHRSLAIGEVPVAELARVYGTPVLALDLRVLDAAIARFERAAAAHAIEVAYAGKALLPVALVRRLARTSLDLDVCSLGELAVAERGGMPAARIVMHGCGKGADEIAAAAAGRAGRVVADHLPELAALAAVASSARPVSVLLRCNTGIVAETHAAIRTSGDGTKFGFAMPALAEAVAFVRAQPGLRLAGLHAHLGSQLFDEAPYLRAADVLVDALAEIVRPPAGEIATLVIGGGFGVDPHPDGRTFDVEYVLGAVATRTRDRSRERGIAAPRLGIEPGRAIVAAAGTSIYEVVVVKRLGERRFAIVDGGIADNPRPALYGAYHHPVAVTGRPAGAQVPTTLCGRACENDELVTAPLPEDLRPGDLIALRTAGAYVAPMASNYNRFVRPPLVFVDGARHHAVVRRETLDDLLRCEIDGT